MCIEVENKFSHIQDIHKKKKKNIYIYIYIVAAYAEIVLDSLDSTYINNITIVVMPQTILPSKTEGVFSLLLARGNQKKRTPEV